MSIVNFIDTHCHLDGEEFKDDLDAVVQRAREAGCMKVFVPAIDLSSCRTVMDVCNRFPNYAYPMVGLHPEEVKADWKEVLSALFSLLPAARFFGLTFFSLLGIIHKDSLSTEKLYHRNEENDTWPLKSLTVWTWKPNGSTGWWTGPLR